MIALTLDQKVKVTKSFSQKGRFTKRIPLSCNEPLVALWNEPNVCCEIDSAELNVSDYDIYTIADFALGDTVTLDELVGKNKRHTLDEKASMGRMDYTPYVPDWDEEDIDLRKLDLTDILS